MFRFASISRSGLNLIHVNQLTRVNHTFESTRALSQLSLGNLRPRDGLKKKRRWGRGTGSGRGKMQGRGHQFSHATPLGFEGGQTPLYKRLPKFGMKNIFKKDYVDINVGTIQQFIDQGRLVPRKDGFTTMRDLVIAGLTHDIRDGIKLLGGEGQSFRTPIHLEVSKATPAAIKAIEQAGGTVTCTYFNTLALRVLTKPYKFELLPWRARPAPKPMQWYLDKDNCGYLSPEIQKRNLKLFGTVTSEKMYREEHASFMAVKRVDLLAEREQQTTAALEKYQQKLLKKKEKDERKQAEQKL